LSAAIAKIENEMNSTIIIDSFMLFPYFDLIILLNYKT
jgi:hypothetical protein